MLSSNFLGFLAMASFALTSATAAALKQPRAAADSNNSNSNNKVCSNTFYSAPQCCIPSESALDTPDCITPASAATASDLKDSCAYGEKSEAMCCSVPSTGVKVLCMPL